MKKLFTLLVFLSFFGFDASAQTVTRLIGASPFQDSLWVFDTTNFNVVRRLAPFPSSGGSITGTNGIATNNATGQIFVIVKQSAVSGRVLGTLDPLTGLVTIVGNTGDNFASITFNGNNTLLGVTGDGASVPETVYRIDQTNASKTVLRTMGNGVDGEVICYNPTDNMIYHWSGNGTVVFEKMDTSGVTVTGIPIIGTTGGETFGMCFIGNNNFIGSNISSRFQPWNANGTVSAQVGSTSPDDIRGTVLITCSRAITGNAAFCAGSSTLLTHGSASATGYQWYFNGAIISGATAQTYAANQVGHYNCIVSDACGTDSSGTGFNVTTQNPLPVVNVSAPQTNLCPNSSITITGTSGGTLQWYLNGSPIIGANSSTYIATAGGVYNETKTNINGCTDSAAVGVTIVAVPNPVVNLGNDTAICAGDTLTLDAMNAGATYVWSTSATTQTEAAFADTTYWVSVTDTNGCSASDTLNLTVNAAPVVNLGNDTTTCGTPVVLDAGNPGASYLWCDGSTTQTAVLSASANCAVIVTNPNGCSSSDTITVTVNPIPSVDITTPADSVCPAVPGFTFAATPAGGTFSGPGMQGTTFTPFDAGQGTHTILYMYTDANGCSSSDSVMMTVFPIVNVSISVSDPTVCIDDADVTLTGSPVGGTFTGTGVSGTSFDPTVAGAGVASITYMYTDTNGCNTATVTTVTVNACVGIEEQVAANAMAVYPNPSNGNIQLILNENSDVVIFNALGENVMQLRLAAGNHPLDMSGLAEGIYVIRAQNANGVFTTRVIIQK